MKADIREIGTHFKLIMLVLAVFSLVLSILGVSFLNDGLNATRGAERLQDFGVVAKVTNVRIHVIRNAKRENLRYSVDDVEVVFTDPQGQSRSESLSSYMVHGALPSRAGWTTQFEGHDSFVGKEVLYLPNGQGEAQMRDQVQSTLDHGFDPAPTYIGIGATVLALLCWAALAKLAIGMLRSRRARESGIA